MMLEFFLHAELDPATSWFSCCLRIDDLDGLIDQILSAGVAEASEGWPRLHRPKIEPSGERIGYLVDEDGTLLRLIANPPEI